MKTTCKILYLFLLLIITSCNSHKEEIDDLNEEIYSSESVVDLDYGIYSEGKLNPNFNIELTPFQFREWVNSSSSQLIQRKSIDEYKYELKYLPVEYMITNEEKSNKLNKVVYDSLKKEYDGMEYFELKLSVDGFNGEPAKYNSINMSDYQQKIMYLSFAMQNDLYIELKGDKKIKCKLFHNERIYGVAPYSKFLFGFSKEDLKEDVNEFKVVFDDQLFNTGKIKFNWEKTTLNNIPKIKLS